MRPCRGRRRIAIASGTDGPDISDQAPFPTAVPTLPLPLILGLVFLAGATLGAALNWAIYAWAWRPRPISPWSRADAEVSKKDSAKDSARKRPPPRRWSDRLPIVGWLGLRREAAIHGRGFWIRPLLVELLTGAGLAWLFHWEVVEQGLHAPLRVAGTLAVGQFLVHTLLISLGIVASLIDVDDLVIPDEVTVTGAALGLLLATLFPTTLLPDGVGVGTWLTLASPQPWPEMLAPRPELASLAIALGCYWLWCFAVLPRPWYGRHGFTRGLQVCMARMLRGLWSPKSLAMIGIGTPAIVAMWYHGGAGWVGLLTSLVGLVVAGGLVWGVRIVGAVTLRREAMGFGDVLLMMMVGSFLGWQACLGVFFVAPFAGVVAGVLQLVLRGEQTIPYGPFLCLGTLAILLVWPSYWGRFEPIFGVPGLVPSVLAACLIVMAVLLLLMRFVKEFVFGRRADN